jgi:hypothetical protein
VLATAGASFAHVTSVQHVASALRPPLRGLPCRGLVTDLRLRVDGLGRRFDPDVLATSSGLVRRAPDVMSEPNVTRPAEPSAQPWGPGRRLKAWLDVRRVLAVGESSRRVGDGAPFDELRRRGHRRPSPSRPCDSSQSFKALACPRPLV